MTATTLHTALQSVVKYFNVAKASTHVNDVWLSRIHYKLVFGLFVACAILSGLTNWYSRINCAISDSTLVERRYIEEWCYANSTFLVNEEIGNHRSKSAERLVYVSYYQWVTLALLLQGVCFQIPRLLWKCLEGGEIEKMTSKLVALTNSPQVERGLAIRAFATEFVKESKEKHGRRYFDYFAVCQFLYFINVLGQIVFAQLFLDYQFLNLLPSFIRGSPRWNQVFPKLAKCTFPLYSPSGTTQTMDVLCVLAMNVLFEKLYLLVWVILAIALCAAVAQNILVFQYMMASEPGSQRRLKSSDVLKLKFLKLSLDHAVYNEVHEQITAQIPAQIGRAQTSPV